MDYSNNQLGCRGLAALLLIALIGSSCGIKKTPYYPGEKRYGVAPEPPAPQAPEISEPEAEPVDVPASNGDEAGNGETEPSLVDPKKNPQLPPGTMIESLYKASFTEESVYLLWNKGDKGEFAKVPKILRGYVDDFLKASSQKLMIRASSQPDGSVSIVQNLYSDFGDNISAAMERASLSGRQTFVASDSCPVELVCLDRMVFSPTSGSQKTTCFYDLTSGSPTVIPYGIFPFYKKSEVQAAIDKKPFFGPVAAYSFEGEVVCADAAKEEAIASEQVVAFLHMGETTTMPKVHQKTALTADYSVHFDVYKYGSHLHENNVNGPYLDETVRLQNRTKFFINEEMGAIVGMRSLMRASIDFEGLRQVIDQYVPIWVKAAPEWLYNLVPDKYQAINGIEVMLDAELCEDLVNETNYCN